VNAAEFGNCYADSTRAQAYAKLEFARTYHLAFRDLPAIFEAHSPGNIAVDFGCGTGRSTRFLRRCGFETVGVDISAQMIEKAKDLDPSGDYRVMRDGDFNLLESGAYDLVLSAFTFDNIATFEKKIALFRGLRGLLAPEGCIVSVVSSPEIYLHEWASFSTKDFPENQAARSGDVVRIITTDYEDSRPVEDILWSDASYQDVYRASGLASVQRETPLARGDEPYEWVSETKIAPWVVWVLNPRIQVPHRKAQA
jgi:trans-aconitate methyltransferase